MNELSNNMTAAEISTFKSMITDKRITINTKGIQQYDSKSYIRFLATTNDGAWFPSERRPVYMCSTLELHSERFARDKAMLWRLTQTCDSNFKAHCAIYRYFETIDMMERFGVGSSGTAFLDPPKGTDVMELRKNNKPYTLFTMYLTDNKFKGRNEVQVTCADMFAIYNEWCEATGTGEKKKMGQLDNELFGTQSWELGAISKLQTGDHPIYRRYNIPLMKLSLTIRSAI